MSTKPAKPTLDAYSTGAVRYHITPSRPDLIPEEFIQALGERYHLGAEIYGNWNWVGLPYTNIFLHATQHFLKLGNQLSSRPYPKEGAESVRSNAAAVAWAMAAIIYFVENGDPTAPHPIKE